MFNPISYGEEVLTVTSSVTLGYGPGQVTPPRELVLNPSAAITVVLPPTGTVYANPPTTSQAIIGAGKGFQLTLRNSTTWAVTVTPYSAAGVTTDTVADTLTLNVVGAVQTLVASPLNSAWYKLGN